jgi:hypothetical protein
MVTIVVGSKDSEEEFSIYADLVKQHSEILEAKLNHISGQAKSKLRMAELSAWSFRIFVAFIYTGYIHTVPVDPSHESEWALLRALWKLGQELESITFKDAVVDAMIERYAWLKQFDTLAFQAVGKHLQAPGQVQIGVGKLLVDITVSNRGHESYTGRPLRPECLNLYGGVIIGLDNIRCGIESEHDISSRTMEGKDCVYHEHGFSSTCYKKRFPTSQDIVRRSKNAMPQ